MWSGNKADVTKALQHPPTHTHVYRQNRMDRVHGIKKFSDSECELDCSHDIASRPTSPLGFL